jgi:hypothetical protein
MFGMPMGPNFDYLLQSAVGSQAYWPASALNQ